ncbi:MAG: GAF domain-containing sensor histidine kinase [Endomicrobia bacterium]|nr:GAF domain-containing sensor histidine kinase [Endomicrobiia bacterium]
MFRNILLISKNPKIKQLKNVSVNLKKYKFNVYISSEDKNEIKKQIYDNTIEIVWVLSDIPFCRRQSLCQWLYKNFPNKLYFSVALSLQDSCNIQICKLLQRNECRSSFLVCGRNIKAVIERFKFLLKRSFTTLASSFNNNIDYILKLTVRFRTLFPLFYKTPSVYISSQEGINLLESIISEVSNYFVGLLKRRFLADKISLFIYDHNEGNYVLVAQHSYEITEEPTKISRSWKLMQKVLAAKKSMLIQDGVIHYPELSKLKVKFQPKIVSSIIVPFIVGEEVIGIVNIARLSPKKEKFTFVEFNLIKVLCRWLSYIYSALISIESALEYEKLKSDFVSIINHELRTPLMSLSASVELLEGKIPQNIEEILKRNIKRLDGLIEEMLDFSRIGKGTFKIEIKENSIAELGKEIVEEYKPQLDKLGIRFILDLPQLTTDRIYFDKTKIKQVIENLINNAIKYSSEERKDKYIKFSIQEEEKYIHIIVEDNGIGIEKKNLKQIFLPFVQVGDIMNKSKPGLGLGLYISKEILNRHKGKIWIESEYGKWTKAHVLLPKIINVSNGKINGNFVEEKKLQKENK